MPLPYFRIFNPMTQGMKFDPDGEYVKRWVPELGALPASNIFINLGRLQFQNLSLLE